MGKKKSRKTVESDIDSLTHDENNYHNDGDENMYDQSEDDYVDDQNEEVGSEKDMEEGLIDVLKGEELEELEKEYRELRNEEQNIMSNLKRHKDEDIQKGQAVKNQRALWDKTLEFRFLLQKPFSSSNRLPQEPVRSLFCHTDSEVTEAYSDLIASSKKTLDSILELQQALVVNNPSITQFGEANSSRDSKQLEAPDNSNGDIDEQWLQISQMQSRSQDAATLHLHFPRRRLAALTQFRLSPISSSPLLAYRHQPLIQDIQNKKMEPEMTLQPLKNIFPAAQNNINAKFILVDKGRSTLEGQYKTCLALVADETAAVHFQLWGDECDAFQPGDIILLVNGIFSYNRNNLVLRSGKRGKTEKVGEFTLAFLETPNLSEIKWAPDPNDSKKYVQQVVISSYSRIFLPLH